jgi:hypothetical protein
MTNKGMSLDECIENATKLISKNDICLLLFDVIDSRNFDDRAKLQLDLFDMLNDLNGKFGEYFPEHNIVVYTRVERGFECLLGDSSWAGINSAEVIPKIIEYQKEEYPNIPLYWSIAKDSYDIKFDLVR